MKTTLIGASSALVLALASFIALVALSCDPHPVITEGEGEGAVAEGEGSAAEGEGAAGEGEGAAGEGEGEGSAGEGEGEGAFGSCSVDGDCDQICGGPGVCTCQNHACAPQQQTCTSNADCPNAPLNACDTSTGQCTFGNCTNGGVVCDTANGETCSADGRCIAGSGAACTSDVDCVDPNEFCSVALGAASGSCSTGCRTATDCNNGQVCSGGHTCVDNAGAFNDPCADAGGNPDDTLCGPGLFCGQFSKKCQESCSGGPVTCTGGSCCAQSSLGCCNQFGFCSAQGC